MTDWKQLRDNLREIRTAAAAILDTPDIRARAAADNARKSYARREAAVLDLLVDALRQRAIPILLVGGDRGAQGRFVEYARKVGAIIVDADRAYRELSRDVGAKAGVLKYEREGLQCGALGMEVPKREFSVQLPARRQFLPEMLDWVHAVARPKWTGEIQPCSYYGRKEALLGTLCQPKQLGEQRFFQDWPSLVAIVKSLFRATNLSDQFGKVGILDSLREIVDQIEVETPVVVVRGCDDQMEARNLSKLFGRPATFVEGLTDVNKKLVTETISKAQATIPNQGAKQS